MERILRPCPPVLLSKRDWKAVGMTINRNNGELCGDRHLLVHKASVEDPCAKNVCSILTYTCMEAYFHHAMKNYKVLTFLAILNLYLTIARMEI